MKQKERKNAILTFFVSLALHMVVLIAITILVTDIEVVKLPQVQVIIVIFSIFVALIITQPEKTRKGR